MALKVLNGGMYPLGQFDALDSQLTSFKGGEVCTWVASNLTALDKASADSFDGYTGTTTKYRPVVTLTLVSGSRPLFLSDDGTTGYGTIFGTIVGGTVGQNVTGTVVGPTTATGSGKITLHDKAGLYGVTLDACDTAADGLTYTNASMTVGKDLTYTTAGLLTPVGSAAAVGGAPVVGRFAEFATSGSLVTTPNSLTRLGLAGGAKNFTMAIFWYAGADAGNP